MLRRMMLTAMALSFSASVYAAKITEGFEDTAVLKKWEIEGDAKISEAQFHGGKSALSVPAGATAIFRFSTENKFGTVIMWVYDSFSTKGSKLAKNWSGPYFGLINSDDDKAVELVAFRTQSTSGVKNYRVVFTGENQWYNTWSSGIARKAGWNKFTFTFTDDKTIEAAWNDEKKDVTFPLKLQFFNKGASGIIFGGGENLKADNETFYYDDIEIEVKDAVKEAPKEEPKK